MKLKYAITLSSFCHIEPIERTLERLQGQGYDAVEMFGEPQKMGMKKLRDIFDSFNFHVCGITGMWGSISEDSWKRRILSADRSITKHTEEYVMDCIKMCQSVGGNEMNICLFADSDMATFDRNHRTLSGDKKEAVIQKAIPLLNTLSKFAKDYGVHILVEPLNRYNTPFCSSAKDAFVIANKVNHDNFGLLLDTFHMNIEEDSFEDTILKSRKLLRHMHFADNNRKMPGYAHINFQSIMRSLFSIGYNGYASFEPNLNDKDYENFTMRGLEFIKSLEKIVSSSSSLSTFSNPTVIN
ncbi:MAG TPA: sugar phosphate isomerase/epimerase family protein [Nitrososphaeraceae archaeon]|nr:sugar phosphate isomerase/epimerase family protein [Nitrososphaeraceae archaeon]